MKRAWFKRIRVWGMSNFGLWGKTHVLPPCFVLPPFLVNLFNIFSWWLKSYGCWWLGAVIVFGSGVAGLSVPCPCAHSTHDCIHSSSPCFPTFTIMVLFILPISWNPHARFGLFDVSRRDEFSFLLCTAVLFIRVHRGFFILFPHDG